jgi:hypothetical protein
MTSSWKRLGYLAPDVSNAFEEFRVQPTFGHQEFSATAMREDAENALRDSARIKRADSAGNAIAATPA